MLQLYRILAYLGLASIFGTMLYGFGYDSSAPHYRYVLNVLLYALYIIPHLVMTRAWFKQRVWGHASGLPKERRVYITVASALWIGVFAIQRYYIALPGPAWNAPEAVRFIGLLLFLLCMRSFFEGSTIALLDGLFGMPGAAMSHSHGTETPLLTEGPYARVRHPHYRAVVLACAASLVMHLNGAQLLWAGMIAASFILFIPIEEAQLVAARGDAYRDYQKRTPSRLFRNIW